MSYYCILGLTAGAAGGWFVSRFGYQMHMLDVPNNRSSHATTVPRGGGIGIFAAVLLALMSLDIPTALWISTLIISMTSLGEDRFNLSPRLRLGVHFACSLSFLVVLFSEKQVGFPLYFLIIPLSIFIVGTSNFYNFMDGVNGISGMMGAASFILLGLFGQWQNLSSDYLMICIVVAFSCAGFLPFNCPHARVFMGDIGSILLGYIFACLVCLQTNQLSNFICMTGFLFLYYADALTTMVIRIKNNESLMIPHRKHLYQLLANEFGITHWKISVAYGIIQMFIGMAFLAAMSWGSGALLLVWIFFTTLFIAFTTHIRLKLKHRLG